VSDPTETPPKRRGIDAELQTMARIDRELAPLDDATTERVLDWLASRHGFVLSRVYIEGDGK
jgi:hypothetical protein